VEVITNTTNKRYAILVHSELRQFEIASNSWKLPKNCDYFFSTWKTSHQYNKNLNINYFDEITEDTIKNNFPNAKICLTDESIFSDVDELRNKEINIKLKYHWKKCLELVKKSNIRYDNVILMRADLWIECDDWDNILNNYSDNLLFSQSDISIDEGFPFIHDMFLMGSLNNIEKIVNYFEEEIPLTHRNLAQAILSNNLNVKKIPISPQIVRPNVRKYNEVNSKIVDDCYNEWSSTHTEEDILFLNKKYKK